MISGWKTYAGNAMLTFVTTFLVATESEETRQIARMCTTTVLGCGSFGGIISARVRI